jgi:hypothetical protein
MMIAVDFYKDCRMTNHANYVVGAARNVRLPGVDYNHDINDITVTKRYQNLTDSLIYVTHRDGLRLMSTPSKRFGIADEFKIFVSYTGRKNVIKNCIDLLNEASVSTSEKDRIKKALTKSIQTKTDLVCTATVEYVISEDQILAAGGRLYLGDLDLLLETERVRPMMHPYSHDGIDRKKIDSLMPSSGEETLAFMFKAVDNTGFRTYGDRYINLGGNVYLVKVEKDDTHDTGIHVVGRKPVTKGEGSTGPRNDIMSTWYTFDEADAKFGLYQTIEEAISAGPIAEAMKEQAVIQLSRDKLTSIREERELQVLRNKQTTLKIESDLQLNPGKTFLEYAKVGTAVLTAMVTVLTIVIKLSSK